MGYIEGVLLVVLGFIILGPKDFSKVLFAIADFIRRLRMASSTFYRHLEDMSEELNPPSDKKDQ